MCRCGHVSRGKSTPGETIDTIEIGYTPHKSQLTRTLLFGSGQGRRDAGQGHREVRSPDTTDHREQEIRRLRNALGTEKNKNKQLITVIEKKVLEYKKRPR